MITSKIEQARIKKALRDCPTPIFEPEKLVAYAMDRWNKKLSISWSGGRCSTAVLYIALQHNDEIKVIFNDTGVEFPETYQFIKKMQDEWNLNLFITKPKQTFWNCVEKYGFPMIRGSYKEDSVSKDGKPKCCQILKENPMNRISLEIRAYATLTGIRACESRQRMFGIAQFGQYYKSKKHRYWKYHPIAFWDTETLLNYIEENSIPTNKVYEMGHDRCGCWPCTGYITWKETLAQSHPKMYKVLARMVGEPTLWEYADIKNCRQEAVAV